MATGLKLADKASAAVPDAALPKRQVSRQQGPVRHASREKYERILAAATMLLADHDFEEISIGQIARAAHVNRTTIYNFFESVFEIFREVSLRSIDTSAVDIREAIKVRKSDDNLKRMDKVIDGVTAYLNSHPVAAKCMYSGSRYDAYLINEDFEEFCASFLMEFLDRRTIPHSRQTNNAFMILSYLHASLYSKSIGKHGFVTAEIIEQVRIVTRGYLKDVFGL